MSPKVGVRGQRKGKGILSHKTSSCSPQEEEGFHATCLGLRLQKPTICFEAHLFSMVAIFFCKKKIQNNGFKHHMGKWNPKCFILLLKQQYNVFLISSTSLSHFLWFVLNSALISLNSSVNYAWRINLFLDWKQLYPFKMPRLQHH